MLKENKILKLIKYNLCSNYNKKIYISALILLTLPGIIYMISAGAYYEVFGVLTNQWDYFFRVFATPFILLWIYIPVIFWVISLQGKNSGKDKYVYLRGVSKTQIIISKELSYLVNIIILVFIPLIITFILSGILGGFSTEWSDAIKSQNNIQIATEFLFFNNFIDTYLPHTSAIICFLEFVSTIYFIVLIRELVYYITKNNSIAILVSLAYIAYNCFQFETMKYFSVAYMGCIWYHKYPSNETLTQGIPNSGALITIPQSLGINLLIILSMVIMITFIFRSREVESI